MLSVLQADGGLKICGDLPQSPLEVWELNPQFLLVPSNQLKFELLCFTGHGVAAAVAITLGPF